MCTRAVEAFLPLTHAAVGYALDQRSPTRGSHADRARADLKWRTQVL